MAQWTVATAQRLTVDEPIRQLDVRLVAGRLNVVGTDGPARIEVTRVGRKPLYVEVADGRLAVRHEKTRRWPGFLWWLGEFGHRFRVDVSIGVPRDTVANLRVIDGSIVASGLRTASNVQVTSGRITLLGLAGRINAKLASGPVEALGVTGDLTMDTISGELTLADSAVERVNGSTVSGSITCDVVNPAGGEIRLRTTSGQITVRVRDDSDLSVHLHTTSGRITSAFPDLTVEEAGNGWGSRDLRGVLGAGAGQLWASSTSGSIALLARSAEELS